MGLRLWAAACLVCTLPSWQTEGGLSDEFLVEELPGQSSQNVFRPRTAQEAMRLASRIANKERSEEDGVQYALLQGAGIGPKGVRVAVHGVLEVTTPRYFHRPRRFRKVSEWPSSRQDADELSPNTPPKWNPHQAFTRNPRPQTEHQVEPKHEKNFKSQDKRKPWQKRNGKDPRRNFRNLKRNRDKRQVDNTFTGGSFDLPPMSNEWNIKKKKKKRKKKGTTTDVPPTKKMQKHSKKFRIYMESSEVNLRKGKSKGKAMDVVRGLSKELDQLLADAQGEEPVTELQGMPDPVTKVKYVPIPKNWQNPPSWRPPTRGGLGAQRLGPRSRWMPSDAEMNLPQYQQPLQVTEPVTEFDWKSYNHPLKTASETDANLVLKPAPSDWPQPTHPADGLYDWHKSQLRKIPRTMRPYPTHSVSSLTDDSYNKRYTRGVPRVSRFYVGYTAAPTDQRVMYQSNHMWQTRAWIPRVYPHPLSTWPTIGTKAAFFNRPGDEDRTHLTPGPPLGTLEVDPGGLQSNAGGENPTLRDAQGYNYKINSQNTPWRGSWQGSRHFGEGSHSQGHQNYYQNFTYQYDRQYYNRLRSKNMGFQYQQNNYHQGMQGNSLYQNQAEKQSRIKPPSYYYNAFEEIGSTATPDEAMLNDRTANLEAPFRQHDEYAGNDRDLRAPLPTSVYSYPHFDRDQWTPARFRLTRMHRKHPARPRRVMGRRPTGYRSIFTAPLQRTSWNTTLPHRTAGAESVTLKVL